MWLLPIWFWELWANDDFSDCVECRDDETGVGDDDYYAKCHKKIDNCLYYYIFGRHNYNDYLDRYIRDNLEYVKNNPICIECKCGYSLSQDYKTCT